MKSILVIAIALGGLLGLSSGASSQTFPTRPVRLVALSAGSFPDIISSIKKKLLVLPGDTLVHAGHGDTTTIDEEKHRNPFLK